MSGAAEASAARRCDIFSGGVSGAALSRTANRVLRPRRGAARDLGIARRMAHDRSWDGPADPGCRDVTQAAADAQGLAAARSKSRSDADAASERALKGSAAFVLILDRACCEAQGRPDYFRGRQRGRRYRVRPPVGQRLFRVVDPALDRDAVDVVQPVLDPLVIVEDITLQRDIDAHGAGGLGGCAPLLGVLAEIDPAKPLPHFGIGHGVFRYTP